MFERLKEKVHEKKARIAVGVGSGTTALAVAPMTALAQSSNDTTANLTSGMTGFVTLVTSMLDTVMGSPTLQIAFAASFAFLAVRLIRRLKKG